MEPLLPHFLQFYEADENATPPLKFEKCVRLQVGWWVRCTATGFSGCPFARQCINHRRGNRSRSRSKVLILLA